jgi:hypothetical protein
MHMLLRVGEDKQRSEPAPSSQPMPDDFLFAVVYVFVSQIYASNYGLGFIENQDCP